MPRLISPTVLMTRPKESSEQFLHALERVAGPFKPLICPAFEYARTNATMPDFDIAIFTSKAGVQFAPDGAGRTAYCVGDATARAASQSGYVAISAEGGADDLVDLILAERPAGRLLHVRGETSVGDIIARVTAGGLDGEEVIVYRKQISDVEVLGATLSNLGANVIIPLFSAETVSILARSNADLTTTHAVAISATVAEDAGVLSPASVMVSATPTQVEMVAAVARLIA